MTILQFCKNTPSNVLRADRPSIRAPRQWDGWQDLLMCALALTVYIQFPLKVVFDLFGLLTACPIWRNGRIRFDTFSEVVKYRDSFTRFSKLAEIPRRLHAVSDVFCGPFSGQKPLSIAYHDIWFFTKPDPFCLSVIRNWLNGSNSLNALNGRSWITLETFMLQKFLRGPLPRDTGLTRREENERIWNRGHCVLCNHMLDIVIKKGTPFLSSFISRGDPGHLKFDELYRISTNWFRFLWSILKSWAQHRWIRPMDISKSTVWTTG
jgi:hypothetical protein